MEDLGNKKRRKTMPLLNVGLTATSPMHETKEKQKKHQYRSTRLWSNIISVGNGKLSFRLRANTSIHSYIVYEFCMFEL
jgi:hypothetical protein